MSDDLLLVVAVMLVTFLVGDGFGAVARGSTAPAGRTLTADLERAAGRLAADAFDRYAR
jgi:hypothetical protein